MAHRNETLREIIKGLDGLVMLTQWELALAKDLRDKVESMAGAEGNEAPPESPPAQA